VDATATALSASAGVKNTPPHAAGISHAVGISRAAAGSDASRPASRGQEERGNGSEGEAVHGSEADPASAPSAPLSEPAVLPQLKILTLEGVELSSDTLHLGPDDGGMVLQTSGVSNSVTDCPTLFGPGRA
jgi:hypothetical protein